MRILATKESRRLCWTAIPPLVSLAAGCCLLLPGEGFWALIVIFMLVLATLVRATAVGINKADSNSATASLLRSKQFTIGELLFV